MSLNLTALIPAVEKFVADSTGAVTGIQKLIADAKSQGLTSVTIADVEAEIAPVETLVADGEAIVASL
jgi:hypothetical protein